jgi:predicted MFS family arabinose efflux permease
MFRPIRRIKDEYFQAYRGLPRGAWILFVINLVNSSGAMVIFFLSLYLTRKLGLSTARAGQVLSIYGAGSLAGAFVGGWLTDRIGSITVQKISLSACGVLLLALAQVRSMAGILPLLFSLALFAGMFYPANAALMSKVCPPKLQVKGFALNRLAGNLGATIGPAVGGVLALRDYRLLFWADGLTSLAAALLFVLIWRGSQEIITAKMNESQGENLRIRQDDVPGKGAPRSRSPWRDGPFLLLLLILLLWYAVFLQILTTFPLYIRNVYGLAENRIGQLFAVNTVMIVTLEMILMEKIRKYPLTRIINVSFILLGVGFGLMPLGRGFAFGAFTVAIWTFGEMLSMPLVTALVAGRADDTNRGQYLGLSSFVFSLAFIVAPVGGTAIYSRLGGDAVWIVCAALGFLLAAAFSALRPALQAQK